MTRAPRGLALAIDLGTTKTAVVLRDPEHPDADAAWSAPHGADRAAPDGESVQDMDRLVASVAGCLARLPPDRLARVRAVGLTGQMHSLVFGADGGAHGPLVTWRDSWDR